MTWLDIAATVGLRALASRLAKVQPDDWVIAAAKAHFDADRPTKAS